jgi:carbon-monoxide dehydrogenase large subunit
MSVTGTPATAARFIGKPVKRREDKRLVTGHGTYVDDVSLPGMLHAAFARSTIARGRLLSVDTSEAEALPGVVAVFTGKSGFDVLAPWWPHMQEGSPDLYPLAIDDVRFVGDPIAIVIAKSRYIAEDAAELIDIEYEPQDPILDYTAAAEPDSPIVHPELPTNIVSAPATPPDPDLDEAFENAAHVVSETIYSGRCTQVPMETRGIIGSWDASSRELTVWHSGQSPHTAREYFARTFKLAEHSVRVIQKDVGGAFGQKMFQGRDELCLLAAAMRVGKPIKWIEDRYENLVAASHAREEHMTVDFAFDAEGVITGCKINLMVDAGSYPSMPAGGNSGLVMGWFPGPYTIPKFGAAAKQAFTNTCQLGPYRGPWAIETTAREMTMDLAARKIGIDPAELRRRNIIPSSALPYTLPTGIPYENISPAETFEQAIELAGYDAFREEQKAALAEGRLLGIGISSYIEPTAFGGGGPLGIEVATIRIEPSGTVTVLMGFGSHGQSVETTMAQVVAEKLGVPLDSVMIVQGDTASAPMGAGNGGSRSAVVGGAVAGMTSEKIKAKVLEIAGHLMEAAPEDLELADGVISVKGSPDKSMKLAEIAFTAYNDASKLPPGMEPGLEDTSRWSAPLATHANATHICKCEVDRDTGLVTLTDYIVSEDCGVIINPTIVDGQIVGGVVQGIGSVLLEESGYDDMGNPTASNFKDYLLPTAETIPNFIIGHVETPSNTPGGHKGAGEGGTIGAIAAVANAVNDALAQLGIENHAVPIHPSRILELIDEADAAKV